jgi:hypothetical protein
VLLPASAESQRAYFERLRPMDPARFARRVLTRVARNDALIIVPGWYKVMWWLNRASPSLGRLLARRMFEVSKRMLLPGGGSSSTRARAPAAGSDGSG